MQGCVAARTIALSAVPPASRPPGALGRPVLVVDYDPHWPARFRSLAGRIAGVLRGMAASIEHVGSTSVPGLAAKPIIDIDVLLASDAEFAEVALRLAKIGYVHQGDLGIPGREAFKASRSTIPHHLYVCPPRSKAFRDHVVLRSYLRNHPHEAAQYGRLKKTLAARFPHDREAYQAAKSSFVDELTQRALVELGR